MVGKCWGHWPRRHLYLHHVAVTSLLVADTRLLTTYIVEENYLYSQNSVSDIIVAHLKMSFLPFEKFYPEYENPRTQNMWIMNPFVEHKETVLSHEETLQLFKLSSDKDWKVLLILWVIWNSEWEWKTNSQIYMK